MPNINSICDLINLELKTLSFSTQRYQGALYNGIADIIKTGDNEHSEFYIIDDYGEAKSLAYNDIYPFQIYHQRKEFTYKEADENYGNAGQTMEETAYMKLIFMGGRGRMLVRPENIMASIVLNFPKEFFDSVIIPLQLSSCVIEMGEINSNPLSVWEEEFKGTDFSLDTDSILISVHYKIISTYNKNCFFLC